MVRPIVSSAFVMVCVLLALNVPVAQAAYRGPARGVPMCAPQVVPVGPGFVTTGPAMAMPRQMSCMPACPPPCPPQCGPMMCQPPCGPTMCQPPCDTGFSPLSAVWGMVTLPFKMIGGLFASKRTCDAAPMCPSSYCMPMLPPPCGPVCAPVTKVKRPRMPRAAYRHAPMPMMQ